METNTLLILLYIIVGIVSGAVMLVKMVINFGMCSGVVIVVFFMATAISWPLSVPLILAMIKANKDEEERK